MADLHRLPHRLGNAGPGRVDQRARRRMRDEDAGEREQQRRVLVAARIQPGQRHQHFAPAHVGIAEQVEGGIGRQEAVLGIGAQQMRRADADRVLDLAACRARGQGRRRRGPAGAAHRCRPSARPPARRPRPSPASSSSRARRSAARSAREPRSRPSGPAARSAAAAAAAPGCRARSGRTGRDGGRRPGISAAGDRRRHTATARPCGPSAPGTRRRQNTGTP